jgi:hypothetical protein
LLLDAQVLSVSELDGYWVAKVEYFDDRVSPSRECTKLMSKIINKLIKILTERESESGESEDDKESEEEEVTLSPSPSLATTPPPPPPPPPPLPPSNSSSSSSLQHEIFIQQRKINQIPKFQEWIEQYGPMPNTPTEFSHWISCAFTTSNEMKQEVLTLFSFSHFLILILINY